MTVDRLNDVTDFASMMAASETAGARLSPKDRPIVDSEVARMMGRRNAARQGVRFPGWEHYVKSPTQKSR